MGRLGAALRRSPQLVTGVAFFTLYLPLLIMLVESFLDHGSAGSSRWTLRWYRRAISDGMVLDALRNSIWVGVWTTVISSLIGTAAAFALQRSRFPGRRALGVITYVPLVMPEIVMGLSLLVWFVAIGLRLGLACIILAHVSFSLSYVIVTVKARLEDFDGALEEAARDLGASSWRAFTHVTFPLIWPAILSGGLIAFTLSFDDFLITFFTAGVGSDTLPLVIYAMIKFGVSPEIHALSCLMILATLVLVALLFGPGRRSEGGGGFRGR